MTAGASRRAPHHLFWDDIDKLKLTDFKTEVTARASSIRQSSALILLNPIWIIPGCLMSTAAPRWTRRHARPEPKGEAGRGDLRREAGLSPGPTVPGIRDREWPKASKAAAGDRPRTRCDRSSPGETEGRLSPYAPEHPCGSLGCRNLVDPAHRRCERHRTQERREIDQRRGSAARRGCDARWRAASKRYLGVHPLCAECERAGRLTAATGVDHIVPHKGDPPLSWNESNWQALCRRCHNRKTATPDGRWG